MQDKHNNVFVLRPFLYAFRFTLSGFYIFSLTFCRVLHLLLSFRRVRLQRQARLISDCILFDCPFKFKMRAESFLPDTLTEFNFILTASPQLLPTA